MAADDRDIESSVPDLVRRAARIVPDAERAVAIVGMACRFPGADDLAEFWRLLAEGRDAITVGARQPRPSGFLRDVDGMDTGFFATSPAEAAVLDPQQRLVLELAWEALEDSRTSPHAYRDRPVGVYVGAMHGDHAARAELAPTRHTLPGLNRGMLANRVSHFLGLRGPSMALDTGQSSALVAVHTAVRAIRGGECEAALAGGVNLLLDERETRIAEEFGALSPDHRCFTFDERANGYVRGEGGAVVVLKPLAAALESGDRIYAVIHGTAVNNDGAGTGELTVPDADAQAEVLRAALDDAGLEPHRVGYVELHGTGTPVGDPVEAAALGRVYGTAPGCDTPLLVGSVKTNIGHLEGAAGIAGLVKAVLALRNGELPPTRNFRAAHPRIPLAELGLGMVLERTPLPADGAAWLGVSSFGMGGVNCHVVLTAAEPHPAAPPPRDGPRASPAPFVLSGASRAGVRARAAGLRVTAEATPDLDALAYSLHRTRARHDHRAVILARDRAELRRGLAAVATNTALPQVVSGRVARTARGTAGRIAFVFPGQGAQRPGMAGALYRTLPAFARHLDTVAGYFAPHLDIDLLALLVEADGQHRDLLDRTRYTQPALFTVELALYRLVRELGVTADYLIGHSIGELVAATAAGAFDAADAAGLVAERGRLMQSAPGGGAMVAIAAGEDLVSAYRAAAGASFDIASVNHREATVISGDAAAVEAAGARFAADGHRVTRLAVSHAFHSAHMDPVLGDFRAVAARTPTGPLGTPVVSNVTGALLRDEQLADPGYLSEQLRGTVRFGAGVETLWERDVTIFLELGPGGGLSSLISGAPGAEAGGRSIAAVPVLRDGDAGAEEFLRALAAVECAGGAVGWERLLTSERRIDLPTYPFQRTRRPDAEQAPPETGEPGAGPETLVRAALARVLGTADLAEDELGADFRSLGTDSLGAVRIRDDLAAATGVALPASLVYDHPTPRAVIAHLAGVLAANTGTAAAPAPVDLGAERERRARASRARADDDVVIVAAAGRWPGGLDSPEQLWAAVADGRDLTGAFPDDRGWDATAITGSHRGGFLYDAADFDAAFFGIGPREARAMDPQQRLLLESTWSCLQRAGLKPDALRGSATGVYIGAVQQEYGPRMHHADEAAAGYLLTGTTNSVSSGRLAYHFGFTGPAVTIDTACSSSLVALHTAVRALRQGDCDLAVVGGVCVMATPGMFTEFGRQGGLAADGRCKPFAADADGTVWAEAVATVLVERRADAVRAGHRILAVVRGTAINSDGASNGLTAPNGTAQQRVIAAALADAGLAPREVDVVETHGTGTALGDPIEAEALGNSYGRARPAETPVLIGSVKSNIGHTQAAAGLTGVIKMIGALRSGSVPATVNVRARSELVDWAGGNLSMPTEGPVSWPVTGHPRTAAVSSFGISGTNAHAILQLPAAVDAPAAQPDGLELPAPLVFSARSGPGLRSAARSLIGAGSADWTALAGESHRIDPGHAHRAVIRPGPGVDAALAAVAAGTPGPGAFVAETTGRRRARAYVFAGQGSQRAGMGARLAAAVPAFAAELETVLDHLDPHLPIGLRAVLADADGAGLVHRTRYTQPAVFAFEVALYRWLERLAPRPDFVAGHSIGELAAAHVAGVFDLDDACSLVTARGRLMDEISADGAMAALEATEAEAADLVADCPGVDIAAVNGPRATVISGDRAAVERIAAAVRTDGRRARLLTVSHAFHSPHMAAMTEEFLAVAGSVRVAAPRIALVSGLTGRVVSDPAELAGDYWVRHARAAVRFADSVRTLYDAGVRTFLEVGADAVLGAMISESAPEPVLVVPATTRRAAEPVTAVRALEALYLDGVDVDWGALLGTRPVDGEPLPLRAFEPSRHWSSPGDGAPGHPFLRSVARAADGAVVLAGSVATATAPWLGDHVVGAATLFPGTAFLELALHAAAVCGAREVVELDLTAPLPLDESDRLVEVAVGAPERTGARTIEIRARSATTPWRTHATGLLGDGGDAPSGGADEAFPPLPESPGELYDRLTAGGYRYGPAFRAVTALHRDPAAGHRLRATLAAGTGDAGFRVHPALLDAALHPLVAAVLAEGSGPAVPAQFRGARVLAAAGGAVTAELTRSGPHGAITLSDSGGRRVVRVEGVTFLPIGSGASGPGRLSTEPIGVVAAAPGGDVVTVGTGAGAFGSLAALRAAVAAGRSVPELVLARYAAPGGDVVAGTHDAVAGHLALLRDWVTDDTWTDVPLVVVVDEPDGTAPHRISAHAVAGAVRSVQHEWPGRFRLVRARQHLDDARIAAAVRHADDPELVLDDAGAHRITVEPLPAADRPSAADPFAGTVLVTGASGALAAVVCRHLVGARGARRLLLASRGAVRPELVAELRAGGARVETAACDVADAAQLRALLAGIAPEAPLTAVLHLAGVLDDAALTSVEPARIGPVLRPKVDAAWQLHEQTRRLPRVAAFVLFSSMVASTGNPGQSCYGAANGFLDGLAALRRRLGLPGTAIAWGLWQDTGGMGAELGDRELARLRRSGVGVLGTEQAVGYLDAALDSGHPHILATPAWPAAGRARSGGVAAGQPDAAPAAEPAPAGSGLAALPAGERRERVSALVRAAVAQALGFASDTQVEPRRGFLDMGVDSMAAVELRNQLAAAAGLRLSATALIDYPTVEQLTEHLLERAGGPAHPTAPGAVDVAQLVAQLERLNREPARLGSAEYAPLLAQARALLAQAGPGAGGVELDLATDDEIFDLIDNQLGVSRDEAP